MDFTADAKLSLAANHRVAFVALTILGMATLGSVCCYHSCIECVIGGIIAATAVFCIVGALKIKNSRKK